MPDNDFKTPRGFKHASLADVAAVQEILRDHYDLDSFLRELLQNADDADATSVHLAGWPGIQSPPHPLLAGPALLVLNDGTFEPENVEGIQYLRVGSKGGDDRSIGKFGLGMKSVFHHCEAVFYMASANQPASEGDAFCQLLNPWSGSGLHDDWDVIDGACRQILIKTIEKWRHGSSRWFCLWLPLRTREQLAGKHPIVDRWPSTEELTGPHILRRAAPLLTLLRSVSTVAVWSKPEDRDEFVLRESIQIDEGAIRRRFPDLNQGEITSLAGRISTLDQTSRVSPWKAAFAGRELLSTDSDLRRLADDDECSLERVRIDPESGAPGIERDRPTPHGAVAFAFATAPVHRKGLLTVSRAVFLPLSKALLETEWDDEFDVQLLLHGYYFLDSARSSVHESDSDKLGMWNRRLESVGTLPLLPAALNAFSGIATFSKETIRRLTRAIAAIPLIQQKRDAVCSLHQWVYRVGGQASSWSLISAAEPYFCVPASDTDPDLPFTVFPELDLIGVERVVTFEGVGWNLDRLVNAAPTRWVTDPVAWQKLLDISPGQVFTNPERFQYLNTFVDEERKHAGRQVWAEASTLLLALAGKALSELTGEELQRTRDAMATFLSFLPAGSLVGLRSLSTRRDSETIRRLAGLGLSTLPVPRDLMTDPDDDARFSVGVADQILASLEQAGTSADERHSELATEVLERAAGERSFLRQTCGARRVFRVENLETRSFEFRTWEELEHLRDRRRLVRSTPALHDLPLNLQRAIDGGSLFRIGVGKLDFVEKVPTDVVGCFEILSGHPKLAAAESRKALVRSLLDLRQSVESNALTSIRYLLHGSVENFSDVTSPLFSEPVDGGTSAVWARIARRVLRVRGHDWTWIPSSLTDLLSPEQRRQLNVQSDDPGSVERLLSECDDLAFLKEDEWEEIERTEILLRIQDTQLWRQLPLHRKVDGTLTTLNGNVFRDDGTAVPTELAEHISVLRLADDPSLHGRYVAEVRPWTSVDAVSVGIKQDHPERYWRVFAEALRSANRPDIPPAVWSELRSASWLPLRGGGTIAPQHVIDLPRLSSEVRRMLTDPLLHSSLADRTALSADIDDFDDALNPLFSRGTEALRLLATDVERHPSYRIGPLPAGPDGIDLLRDIVTVTSAADPNILPGIPMLAAIARYHDDGALRLFLGSSSGAIPIDSVRAVMARLAEYYATVVDDDRDQCSRVFDYYLQVLASHEDFEPGVLTGTRLLNQRGRWKLAEALCFDAAGVDESDLVNRKQGTILRSAVGNLATGDEQAVAIHSSASKQEAAGQQLPALADVIVSDLSLSEHAARTHLAFEEFFASWDGRIAPEALGGFISLFGDNDAAAWNTASKLLAPRFTVRGVRDRLADDSPGLPPSSFGGDIHAAMDRHQFRLSIRDLEREDTVAVQSLAGTIFNARIRREPTTLFIGDFRRPSLFCHVITMRKINAATLVAADLRELLVESARVLLQQVYGVENPEKVDTLFEVLCDSEQLDLDLAQRLILENAFFYLRQLHDRRENSALSELARKWDEVRYREVEAERTPGSDRGAVAREKQELRERLRRLLETDTATQVDALAAVRTKVENYQYAPASVPFELFQNADDAVVELGELVGPVIEPLVKSFVVIRRTDSVGFCHWGRSINRFRGSKMDHELGSARGFNRDLEKMLILSSSDKSEDAAPVTGKFGLGFKSSFLVSDVPLVISGRLAFEVRGGMYPAELAKEDRTRIQKSLDEWSNGSNLEGTLIELPLRESLRGDHDDFLARFKELVHVLLVFSKRVKRCTFIDSDGSEMISWVESAVDGTNGVSIGDLRPARTGSQPPTRAVVFRGRRDSAVLMTVGAHGFQPLPSSVPAFWVTAPTTDGAGAGIAVTGRFAVDVGRAKLAGDMEHNRAVAEDIGEDLGIALVSLFDAAADWPRIQDTLGLETAVTPADLWESLWDVAAKGCSSQGVDASASNVLLRQILWVGGVGALIRDRAALPTGLLGTYAGPTCLDGVASVIDGVLDTDEVFATVATWPAFRDHVAPGTCISQSRVAAKLDSVFAEKRTWKAVSLLTVLSWELSSKSVEPAQAARLADIVTPALLNSFETNRSNRAELETLQAYLAELKFRSRSGVFRQAPDLLVSCGHDDEALRAAFAPDDRVLDIAYDSAALLFFRACRPTGFRAQAKVLVEWGSMAEDTLRRQAFLRYLIRGELAHRVAVEVPEVAHPGSWVKSVRGSGLLDHFQWSEQFIVLGRLEEPGPEPQPQPGPLLVRPSPVQALRRIREWWSDSRSALLDRYLTSVFPSGAPPVVNADYGSSVPERKEWLTLFLHGMLLTQGRARPEQHRQFVSMCLKEGWLDELSRPGESNSLLKSFVDHVDLHAQEIPYFHWMKNLLGLIVVRHWLDDYVAAFLAVQRMTRPFSVGDVMRPRTWSALQQGGPDAPPISRILGIGGCFVMRELIRANVLSTSLAYPNCYVPTGAVRRAIRQIGGPDLDTDHEFKWERSKAIHEFLDQYLGLGATFDGAFDIPFQLLGSDDSLQHEVLGRLLAPEPEDDDGEDEEI